MRLTNLADHLRSWGLTVVEEPGWQTRGVEFPAKPHVVVAHHTATPQSSPGDYPSLRVVRDGRSDLRGPLSQVGLGRSGKVYVIAAGKANHAGTGSWAGYTVGNADSIGVEAESPGDGSWTPAQRATYPKLCAALLDLLGSPAGLLCAHRESATPAGRKNDPAGIDMNVMRAQAKTLLTARHAPPHPAIVKEGPRDMTDADVDALVKAIRAAIQPDLLRLARYLRGQNNGVFNDGPAGLPAPKDCACPTGEA